MLGERQSGRNGMLDVDVDVDVWADGHVGHDHDT